MGDLVAWLSQPVDAVWVLVAVIIAGFAGKCLALWLDCRRLDRQIEAYNEHWREMWS